MKKICMIAGWGHYPVYVAKALAAQGFEVHCFGVVGHADRTALTEACAVYRPIGMCKLGRIIHYMRRHGIVDFIALGKYFKWRLFRPTSFFVNLPDWLTFRTFASYFLTHKHDCKDDSLMLALVRLFERFGLKMGAPTDYVPELLAEEGILTKKSPTEAQWRDIRYGLQVAKTLGRFDVGQSVVVANGVAIALEGIEGTDRCIERAGELCTRKNLVLVKVAKPKQDMRFDVPTIGLQTLETFAKAGGQVIAIEAKRSILVDRTDVLEFADAHGIAVCAVQFEETTEESDPKFTSSSPQNPAIMGPAD
ncbi:MAG: UDP-2,3-diacylglucosamine diphosphatase LpxI [Thermoguttaceae bacterium]|nr:UDP-2,3-diacylglucosamine diphosphatase LpxI [Thermoguttaceae bacterium]